MGKRKKRNRDGDKSDWIIIKIHDFTEKEKRHILNAIEEFKKGGVRFDHGIDFIKKEIELQLDWSLAGATVKVIKK